uniref:Lem3/Cdc50 n=1 Tax=Rhabditophanes sp. KR3021 TaxID=114890 RepID=A0AC35U7Q9_9BILA
MRAVVIPKIPKHKGLQNKPNEAKWRQQTLPSYRPKYQIACVLPIIFVISAAYLAMAIFLSIEVKAMKEISIDYTDCVNLSDLDYDKVVEDTMDYRWTFRAAVPGENNKTICLYRLLLKEPMVGNITLFYGLKKFHQNWRKYFNDRSNYQLEGEVSNLGNCESSTRDEQNNPIAPCGSVANTKFNDSFRIILTDGKNIRKPLPLSGENILYRTDRLKKFKNPPHVEGNLCAAFNNTAKPSYWEFPTCLTGDNITGYGFENLDFIVWMKSAAFPIFRKPYRTLLQKPNTIFEKGMPVGLYDVNIEYNYPVIDYKATKKFIIATKGLIPTKNDFLTNAYFMAFGFIFSTGLLLVVLEVCFKHF